MQTFILLSFTPIPFYCAWVTKWDYIICHKLVVEFGSSGDMVCACAHTTHTHTQTASVCKVFPVLYINVLLFCHFVFPSNPNLPCLFY